MEKITKSSDKVLIDPNEPLILPDGTALVGRVEWFLYALCCLDYQNLPTPMSRIEEFANALITGEVPNIEPQSRAEQFFLAILDGNVSDLPQPQSRSEVLLDKLARGEFDLSDVEPIQSHYELLLAYLIKNGGIGNIDYVLYEFSEAMKTMYNTVEKPFKSLELSGNTLVNCVLEDTENDDYTSFDKDYSGTSFTINGTSEGAIKSAILKGQTLVNLLETKKEKYTFNNQQNWVVEDGYLKCNGTGSWHTVTDKFNDMIKPSTKYLLRIEIVENTLDMILNFDGFGTNIPQSSAFLAFGVNEVGVKSHIVTTAPELDSTKNGLFRLPINIKNGGTLKIRFMAIEYQDGMENWDIPHFEGMQSVKMPVLTTCGKNLFDMNAIVKDDFELGKYQGSYYGKEFVLQPNTRYTIKPYLREDITSTSVWTVFNVVIQGKLFNVLNVDKTGTTGQNAINQTTFTTDSTGKVGYSIYSYSNSEVSWLGNLPFNIQLEKSSIVTSYEPFKSNILTVNEPVELRGIGEVRDELDLLTGELTECIGEIVLDGSESWVKRNDGDGSTTMSFTYVLSKDFVGTMNGAHAICDKFQISNSTMDGIEGFGMEPTTKHLYFEVSRTKASSLDEWKSWLSNNNVTIQYELAIPTVKTVDLNVVDQNNTKIDKIHVFDETTHVNASSDELTPTVNIGKSVSYPTIIKPNTKYTVDLKRNDKPLTVNLGGTEVTFASGETRKVITTPSTLTNDKLSYYGIGAKCSEIMLIEGEIERNIDYFTGMQSVVMQNQMPILHTVSKNLFSREKVEFNKFYIIEGNLDVNNEGTFSEAYGLRSLTLSLPQNENFTFSIGHPTGNLRIFASNEKPSIRVKGKKIFGTQGANVATFNTGDYKYFTIVYYSYNSDNTSGKTEEETIATIQIEQGTATTPYEPHKSSILSCNEDITLRGIGDVRDELDCLTGEVVERIGEIVLDGGNISFTNSAQYMTDTSTAVLTSSVSNTNPYRSVKCNKLPSYKQTDSIWAASSSVEMGISGVNPTYSFCIRLPHSLTGVQTTDDFNTVLSKFKTYLQANPITVQYELATESIETVALNVVDQDGNTIPKVKSHNGTTHLEVTVPKQSLLPNVSAEVATDNSKDMSSLTVKHQEISETQSAIQDNIQSQSDEIDTALMATTEIFESILE